MANDAVTPTEIEIPTGEYTISEMVTKLNDLFQAKGLELDATIHETGDYKGIKITSTVKGNVSQVGLDEAASSAYDTLFVDRRYNEMEQKSTIDRDHKPDQNAQVVSRKEFQPLTIDNTNNQFVLSVDNQPYTITLDGGACNSASDLQTRIQNAINNRADLNGKLTVSATASGCIKIEANSDNITAVNVRAASGNNGYQDIFVKTVVTKNENPVTATGGTYSKPSLTLGETLSNPVDFTGKSNTLDITINGKDYTVTFPVPNPNTHDNTYTQGEIKDIINEQIKNQAGTVNKTFQQVSASGHAPTDRNFNLSGSGTETKVSQSYQETGKTKEIEGLVGKFDENEPAKVTLSQPGNYPFTIDHTCNQLQLNINGVEKSFTLDEGKYENASALAAEIQKKIGEVFGTNDYGGATVTVDADGKLVLTAGLKTSSNTEEAGSGTTISCSTATSTFLEKLHTVKTPASVTSTVDLQPSITLKNETLTFSYKDEAGEHPVSVSLSGTYDRERFVAALNQKLPTGVRASLDGARLKLETTAAGTDTSISFDSKTGGTAIEAMFGNLTKEAPASATAPQTLTNPTVVNDKNDKFEVTVNGQAYTVTLDHPAGEASYTPAQLVAMLNRKLKEQGIGLTATLSGNRITYTTTAVGVGASFSVDWNGIIPAPGVTASISGNQLTLTGTETGRNNSISVKPQDNSVFQKPKETTTISFPETVEGYRSTIHAAIDGVNITEPVNINKYNNTLSFYYYDDGVGKTISISFDESELKDYNFSELQSALQAKVDAKAGVGKLTVKVDGNGVRIEENNVGSKYYLANPSGGFYDRVLCSYKKHTQKLTPTTKNGSQTKDAVFTVGRKDIVSKLTNIRKNINDTLSLDFTCTGMTPPTIPLKFQLDQGLYTGESLKTEIQKKLNEQLKANGLPENLIEVGIGGVTTTTSGSNDDRALVFKLSESVRLPGDGEYVIDGVGGSAAFSVFYRTDGELDPAYLGGTKDISNGVTIGADDTELKFKIDDKEYGVTIPQGNYSADGIVDTLTKLFKDNGIPAIAERHGDHLRIVSSKMGNHKIHSVSGGAKYALFFQDNWNYDPQYDVKIQVSGNTYDYVEIKKPILNTCFLRINTVTISKPKYADKALVRLDYAINKVSEHRSEYGAMNNRLEHIINNNQNMEENTQQAESRIRDADMATEMMNYATASILEQASQAMMTQAKQTKENVLRLLEL